MPYLVTDFKRPTKKPQNRRQMIAYLAGHPRYHTMNSWNRATSYSRCIKLHHIAFPDKAVESTAWDLVCSQAEWWRRSGLQREIAEFDKRYNHRFQLGTNGRSGGYVVVYQGGTEPSGVKSYCQECGQHNYTRAEPEPARCGRCGEQARVNYATEPEKIICWPGRSLDEGADYAEWDTETLKDRVDLVWDLDDTVERMAAKFIEFCRTHTVEEETVLVPTVRQVARPK